MDSGAKNARQHLKVLNVWTNYMAAHRHPHSQSVIIIAIAVLVESHSWYEEAIRFVQIKSESISRLQYYSLFMNGHRGALKWHLQLQLFV